MHNINEIRKNPQYFVNMILRRGEVIDIERLVKMIENKRIITSKLDDLRSKKNELSKCFSENKISEKQDKIKKYDLKELRNHVLEIGTQIKKIEQVNEQNKSELISVLMSIPNIPSSETPDGTSAHENIVIRQSDQIEKGKHEIIDHLTFGEKLGILDFERSGKITGAGFPLWSGLGATLERALINFMLEIQTNEHGYREMMTPFMANRASMIGSAQIPRLENDMYHLEKDDLFLIPTSEVTLINLHRDEIIPEKDLPLKYTAFSANFRREAGSYGSTNRGLQRLHQFNKIELVRFEQPDSSESAHEELVKHAETILQRLEIPYRVMLLCAGDLSFQAAKCYDIDVWAPAEGGRWLEASSCSNCKDFQARRANIRYRPNGGGKPQFLHTLNGSGLATSRLMVAILENYQTENGSLEIPAALRSYMHNRTVISAQDDQSWI